MSCAVSRLRLDARLRTLHEAACDFSIAQTRAWFDTGRIGVDVKKSAVEGRCIGGATTRMLHGWDTA